MTAAVEFDRITCTFAAPGGGGSYTAVKDVTLAIGAGEFVAVVGPTGCGKSTLLNVAAGLLRPSSGGTRVSVLPNRSSPNALAKRRAGSTESTSTLPPRWVAAIAAAAAAVVVLPTPPDPHEITISFVASSCSSVRT